jgi:hypothetical protein
MVSTWIAGILITLAGFYSVATMGVTGGPKHGEHSFIGILV